MKNQNFLCIYESILYRVDFSTDKKLCKSRYNTLEVQCGGWWSRQNCFNFWIYVAIWAWNWICKGSAAWLKKHWVHTSTAMLLLWAAKKHHVMDVTYFKSCIFSQKKTLIYFQTYSKVSTSSSFSLSLNDHSRFHTPVFSQKFYSISY